MAISLNEIPDEGEVGPEPDPAIAALLRERDGYINRGMGDRVAQVEAELERRGVERIERATVVPKAREMRKR